MDLTYGQTVLLRDVVVTLTDWAKVKFWWTAKEFYQSQDVCQLSWAKEWLSKMSCTIHIYPVTCTSYFLKGQLKISFFPIFCHFQDHKLKPENWMLSCVPVSHESARAEFSKQKGVYSSADCTVAEWDLSLFGFLAEKVSRKCFCWSIEVIQGQREIWQVGHKKTLCI